MPKEQPSLNECSPCAASSRNAKDKSNSMALLAVRDTRDADVSSGRGSRCSSEKDSGYSDGSDWQQADVEDGQRKKSQFRASEHVETSQLGQNQEIRKRNPGNPFMTPDGCDHSSTYIVKDTVLKQPGMIQKRGQLVWRSGIVDISHSGSPQMILCQQPNMLPATLQLQKPSSQKLNVAGSKINRSYLPILNSYPRIAPHPSKKPPDKPSLNCESQNLSKKVCTKHKSDDTAVTTGLPEQHLHKQPKLAVSTSGKPSSPTPRARLSASSPTTASMSQRSPSVSSQDTSYSLFTTSGFQRNATTSIRHRRFLNTIKILRQSGLLDITLRTKELMRQSSATERDLTQLRQHTELLCQAASNPSLNLNGVTALEHLHRAMAESDSYPNLKILPQPDSASRPESISKDDDNRPQDLPNYLLSTLSEQHHPSLRQLQPKQGSNLKAGDTSSDKVTFTPPDSSTG